MGEITSFLSGWWFQPLQKILVSWDDEIPNIWKNKSHVPNHQPAMAFPIACTTVAMLRRARRAAVRSHELR